METKVVHINKSPYDIYIGRPRKGDDWGYGNPFEIGRDGNRTMVIYKYERWLKYNETFDNIGATEERRNWILENLPKLKGKILGCFCAPANCHGLILAQMANK